MPIVIADDLTGAAELGGVAWRYGLTAEVHAVPGESRSAEVTAIDTDSRGCAGEEAARRVEQTIRGVAGQSWVYKKVDSVLRGPVLAELVHSMGWRRLKVVCELAPGVVRMEAGCGAGTKLTMKPGSYIWPAAVWPRAEKAGQGRPGPHSGCENPGDRGDEAVPAPKTTSLRIGSESDLKHSHSL